ERNFSFWKLKMKVILRKDKCLAAIGERPAEVTDDSKWNEMDGNDVANPHLALADGVLQISSRQVEALVVTRKRSMEPGSSGIHNHGKSKKGKKKNFKCFKCGKLGHFRKDCRGLIVSYPQGMLLALNVLCCEVAVANESRKRFADVCYNDHELNIIGIGSIMVKVHDGTLVLMRGEKVAGNLYRLKGETMKEAEASHRLKFKTSNSRSVYVLELVHSDVWQSLVLSLRGAKYFVSFIDDNSRRCWVYPIKKKSDVFEVFKVYKARVELDSRKKIKCLGTDNGGE
nr:retrovirus-related Pol polyprotein from transposon TNT 1-94 [Tanacetum cinerariifolium]